ncbi:uncharacterized protein B0H18DRAFT_1115216 [Fomitopsis serialis]|uniref:uncharacterized protein n=1 Tax=Fomitopsis serialis TaxID=139415 RepID=UPI0020081CD1|nr:uncharacterized protein B0H18DRAFT_1115216 [Neoantrodia serialis]KAH9933853.1 hypothetical protein B0H18DRAFT_1115216 [Neoantrodia serialis]
MNVQRICKPDDQVPPTRARASAEVPLALWTNGASSACKIALQNTSMPTTRHLGDAPTSVWASQREGTSREVDGQKNSCSHTDSGEYYYSPISSPPHSRYAPSSLLDAHPSPLDAPTSPPRAHSPMSLSPSSRLCSLTALEAIRAAGHRVVRNYYAPGNDSHSLSYCASQPWSSMHSAGTPSSPLYLRALGPLDSLTLIARKLSTKLDTAARFVAYPQPPAPGAKTMESAHYLLAS